MPESTAALVPEPLVPPLGLTIFIAIVAGAAALANCAVVAALYRRSRNGILAVVVQVAIADLILLITTIAPELWSLNAKSWTFGNSGCAVYQGFSVFTSTASSFLIATVALHTHATIKLKERIAHSRIMKNIRSEDEELKTSQHSLVTSSDSSTPPRTMNVDYRVTTATVPVTLPCVFVWILSGSLSIPEFVLGTVVRAENDVLICTLDLSHRFNVHSMLMVFNLFLPMFIMSTSSIVTCYQINSRKIQRGIEDRESVAALKLAFWFVIVYFILCTPRAVVGVYSNYSQLLNEPSVNIMIQRDVITVLRPVFSGIYLIATLVKPLLCIILLPQLRKVFSIDRSAVRLN